MEAESVRNTVSSSVKDKMNALNRATESFRATKRRKISQICSVGVRHKYLKYPALFVAMLFILFANIVFYVSLFVLLNKKRAIGIAIMIVAAVGLAVVFSDYNSSKRFYANTEDIYVTTVKEPVIKINDSPVENSDKPGDDRNMDVINKDVTPEWYEQVTVDFDGLLAVNGDIVGWICFENEDISYPILQGATNDDYINTTYLGESSRAGSIFLDSSNSSDFEDFHSIIYGHNMRNKTMFGKLSAFYKDSDYYEGHEYFQIITPEKRFRYLIVGCKQIKEDNRIYDLKIVDDFDPDSYVQQVILNNSILGMNVSARDDDRFVTLSTCVKDDTRFIVSAIRVDVE